MHHMVPKRQTRRRWAVLPNLKHKGQQLFAYRSNYTINITYKHWLFKISRSGSGLFWPGQGYLPLVAIRNSKRQINWSGYGCNLHWKPARCGNVSSGVSGSLGGDLSQDWTHSLLGTGEREATSVSAIIACHLAKTEAQKASFMFGSVYCLWVKWNFIDILQNRTPLRWTPNVVLQHTGTLRVELSLKKHLACSQLM